MNEEKLILDLNLNKSHDILIAESAFGYIIIAIILAYMGALNFFISLLVIMCAFIVVIWRYYKKIQIRKLEKFKNEDLKKQAYIIEAHHRINRWPSLDVYYFKLSCGSKTINTKPLVYNNAYRIIKLMLESYPIKAAVRIPIDVYFFNKYIYYIDIESVKLNDLDGYEEAKNILSCLK